LFITINAMANKYANGKIYAIMSPQTDKMYIGSTTQLLHTRWIQHKSDFKTREGFCYSSEIIKYGDAYIILLEDFPCNSKKELNRQEGTYIQNNKCVNKCIAGRTRKEKQKEYGATHKEHLAKRMREYREKHPEVKEYQKQYRLKNKEHLNERSRKNYYDHKQS